METAIPLAAMDQHAQLSQTTRSTRASSSTTDKYRPGGLRNCASAFYDHPPTSISLTQIESSRQVPTLKTFAIKLPKQTEQIIITPATPDESPSAPKIWIETSKRVDIEAQSNAKSGLPFYRRAWLWTLARKRTILWGLTLFLGVVIAIALGVAISLIVNGHIGLNTKGRGF